jgi:hypothetical protein
VVAITGADYHARAMGWLVLLLIISPAAYLAWRLYYRAADAPPLPLRAFIVGMCFVAALVVVVLLVSSLSETHEGDDLLRRGFG